MEVKAPEVLDDLRKKRLAYFQTSGQQPSVEDTNTVKYETSNAVSSLKDKEPPDKLERERLFSHKIASRYHSEKEQVVPQSLKESMSKEINNSNLNVRADIKNSDYSLNSPDTVSNGYSKENSVSRNTSSTRSEKVEVKETAGLKTTSFYFTAEDDTISASSPGNIKHYVKESLQTEQLKLENIENGSKDTNEIKQVRHVHYDDGYNETVERLIQATKEEILGKQVQDDIWSSFRNQQNSSDQKVKGGTSVLQDTLSQCREDSRNEFQDSPVYSKLEPKSHAEIENKNLIYDFENEGDIFQSKQKQSNGTWQTDLSLKDSFETTKVELGKSQDLTDLGLSTHRPDSDKVDKDLTVEMHGVKLNESLTRQLRYALGEEKFKEFIEKSKKDIDVLQQERISARSEKSETSLRKNEKNDSTKNGQTPKAVIETKGKEKKLTTPSKSEDFTPRNDAEAVHEMIGEHVLKKKEPRQKLTSNPAYKQKTSGNSDEANSSNTANTSKKTVPELNLSDVNDSPRPLLNRPKHEPYNIYQDKLNKHATKKPEIKMEAAEVPASSSVKNYEQVIVSRNVVFSADEIYKQAYGMYPDKYIEHSVVPESSHGVQVNQQGILLSNQGVPLTPHGIPLNSYGAPMTPYELPNGIPLSPHAVQMTPHGIPVTPHGMGNDAFISSHGVPLSPHGVPMSPHGVPVSHFYPSNFGITPVPVSSAVSVSISQKFKNAPVPPQFISSLAGSSVEHKDMAVPSQSTVSPETVQVPHPPSHPPPTYSQAQQFSANISFGTTVTPNYVVPVVSSEHQQMPQTSAPDLKGLPVQQGVQHVGYPVAYSYPYPVMVMAPHPPAEPLAPSDISDKTLTQEKSTATDRVEEETTFTSVSQIPPREEDEVKMPHPPQAKKTGKQRSPRKVTLPDRAAKRHIDGIRHHHEQRRQEQEDEKLTEAQIVEKQRKFAKASIERYFQSLENLYHVSPKSNTDAISDVLSEIPGENEYNLSDDSLAAIPDTNVIKHEIHDNQKMNEIFKTTDPENFDIADRKHEMDLKHKTQSKVEAQPKVEALKELDNTEEKIEQVGVVPALSKHDVVTTETKSKIEDINCDGDTLVNTAVTGFSVKAGGITERLNELGIDADIVKGDLGRNEKLLSDDKKQGEQKVKKGKLLIICPECEGFNKEYMSWCTHCGEMIIGIEPKLVSKNRQGKIRTKPVTLSSKDNTTNKLSNGALEQVNELNGTDNTFCASSSSIDRNKQPISTFKDVDKEFETVSTEFVAPAEEDDSFEKPITLDLGLMKNSKDISDPKLNVSPNKSDGKDSGRPSSDDQEVTQNINARIEQEVEDDICDTITDPVVKGYVKSHFAKRRQAMLEHKSLPADENMKSKVQSWIEEIGISGKEPGIAQTEDLNNAPQLSYSIGKNSSVQNFDNKVKERNVMNEKTVQNVSMTSDNVHLNGNYWSNSCVENTFDEKETNHLHFETSASPTEEVGMPPEIPKFGANIAFDSNELALKLVTDSMDFSQLGSVDFSHVDPVNILDKKEISNLTESQKAKAKQERRNKRGHGAIDVEIFGYEESRECKNSSRGQRIVPILNLPDGSSDEDDSDQADLHEKVDIEKDLQGLEDKNDAVVPIGERIDLPSTSNGEAAIKKTEDVKQSLAMAAWQSIESVDEHSPEEALNNTRDAGGPHSPVPALIRPEEDMDDWQLLFDPTLAEDDQEETSRQEEASPERDQPFLMQLVGKKGSKGKRPKSSKGKPVKSKMRQSMEAPGYQRKWAKSSTAWSSYNPGELKTSSSLRASTDTPGPSSDRSEGHDLSVTSGNLSERSVSPVRPAGNKGRPASADVYKRKQQKQRPVSAGLRKSRDRSQGNRDKNDDKLYNLVEHRLPRKGIQELLQDRIISPRSTYDKYLEMTPRIHEGTLSCWQCLPDEILIHIFAYLGQSDLTRCAQVCHQFYRVAMDESLWKYITIKKKTDLDDSCLTEISRRHPVSLALIHCHGDQVTAKGLRDMFRECADSLKELNISRCSQGALHGDSILLHAAARCHNLTHIDTSWCNITDSGLMAVSSTCNRLESLCINGCQAVSNDGLETVIKKHGASLRVLEMFGCFNITPRGLQAVSNNCINLISLHLGQCYKLTDSSIAQLSSSLGRVETLDLRGCKQLKDNCIRRVVKNCTRLKHLSLANCPNITDVSILEISTYLTDIRSIDLCGCKNITDSSIRALVNTCTNLRHIDISSTSCTHRSVSMIANFSAQRLESLRINFLSDVTEASLIKLAKHCKRYQLFGMNFDLEILQVDCIWLTSVHLYGCPSVKNLDKVKEERPTFTIEM